MTIKRFTATNGHTLTIDYDTAPADSPRDWEQESQFLTWHNRYSSPDENPYDSPQAFLCSLACKHFYPNWENTGKAYCAEEYIEKHMIRYNIKKPLIQWCLDKLKAYYVILPVFMYEHTGTVYNTTGFSCKFDSGQVGYIFIATADVKRINGLNRITKKTRAEFEKYLNNEVDIYSQYVNGEIYSFNVTDSDGNHVDSCCGFYDLQDCIDTATGDNPNDWQEVA